MTPKPLQKGCWPDGTVGPKTLYRVRLPMQSGSWHVRESGQPPDPLPGTAVDEVPVLPVELVEGLVHATAALTEEIERFTSESERLGRAVNVSWGPLFTARDAAEKALGSYRQAMEEGQ